MTNTNILGQNSSVNDISPGPRSLQIMNVFVTGCAFVQDKVLCPVCKKLVQFNEIEDHLTQENKKSRSNELRMRQYGMNPDIQPVRAPILSIEQSPIVDMLLDHTHTHTHTHTHSLSCQQSNLKTTSRRTCQIEIEEREKQEISHGPTGIRQQRPSRLSEETTGPQPTHSTTSPNSCLVYLVLTGQFARFVQSDQAARTAAAGRVN